MLPTHCALLDQKASVVSMSTTIQAILHTNCINVVIKLALVVQTRSFKLAVYFLKLDLFQVDFCNISILKQTLYGDVTHLV